MLQTTNDQDVVKRPRARGFGFIEIMVALAIIGVLGMLAVPSYQGAIRKTKRAEARAALMQLMQQEERFYAQNTRYIAFSADSIDADEKKFKWYSGDSAASSSYEMTATTCGDEAIQTCVELRAEPGTDKVNKAFKDPACGTLTLTSTGFRHATGTADDCWK